MVPEGPGCSAARTLRAALATVETMLDRFAPPPETRRILKLARSDRAAAERELAELSAERQVALVCEAPVARRAELLELLPAPERVVPQLPEAELCFTVKAIGLADAAWILEYATPDQVVACLDLDAWGAAAPDRASLDAWFDALAETSADAFLRGALALDPEIVCLYLRSRIEVVLKHGDDPDWQDPPGAQTLDGQFYFTPRSQGDDVAAIVQMLRTLFVSDYWTYFRLLQGVIWELDAANEEWALRWRTGRLEDLGFPPWERAMNIYHYLAPPERAALPRDAAPLEVYEWRLPVWVPQLPTGPDARQLVFRSIALLEPEERRGAFFALVALANKVAVADRLPLSDVDSTPLALEKAARFASAGLEFVAAENRVEPVEVLRRAPLERLFNVGANLDPEGAKP